MDSLNAEASGPSIRPTRLPFYYGWVTVSVAALAMVGTLPGRTIGLGMITESVINDLQIGRVSYARINFWATLIGALFAIGFGRLIDRFGSRVILTIVSLLLGLVVLGMSSAHSVAMMAVLITLTRGFGQSALSVISITIVGHWFVKRINLAMAVYSVLLSMGFMIAFPVVLAVVQRSGWRTAWAGVGGALLLVLVPAAWFLVRRSPESIGLSVDGKAAAETKETRSTAEIGGFTLVQALMTPAFWAFALSSSVYGLIASGIALFNESILAERGFNTDTYSRTLIITALTGLAGNFLGGWLTSRWSIKRLMTLAMGLVAGSLLALPHITTQIHVILYALVMGLAGGFVTVIFFSFWSLAFGRAHLGKIQGAAQALTVLASAIGPEILAQCKAITGSYAMVFYLLTAVVAVLGLSVWLAPMPQARDAMPVPATETA